MKITAQTRIAGVVGNPVRHSLSPIIHNAWIEAAGLDAVYLAFEPPKDRFRQFIDGLRGGAVLGLNVTIPFKEEALALADMTSGFARRAGAANLLLFRPDGNIEADNTDGIGLITALNQAAEGRPRAIGKAVIIGAGGAARGAALALLDHGAISVTLVNRTLARAEEIAALDARIEARPWTEAGDALEGTSTLVNATSLGMRGQPPLELPLERLPNTAVVMDMVYRPLETPLLAAAMRRRLCPASGIGMLIGQAEPSFARIFGVEPPSDLELLAPALKDELELP
jgi:shikimate dehydrogenase